jgi:autotransporter-associated beta strand protein
VTFDDSAAATTVSIDDASVGPSLVTFANASKDYSLSGGTLVTAGGVTKAGAGNVTLAGGLEAGGDVVVSAGALALNGTANAFVGLTVTGGTLSRAAARNTFTTGSISVTGGELRFQGTANGAIAITKTIAAIFTHSGSMLAEAMPAATPAPTAPVKAP